MHLDYDSAVSVTRNIYWVGFREEGSRLRCNPYLLIDDGVAVLVDPGSIPDFPLMARKVIEIIDPGMISMIVVGHQDPDVAGCLPVLEDVVSNPELRVAAHSNTLRLIQHLGFVAAPFAVDKNDFRYELPSGDELRFIPTPYAHSPGAMATYHPSTKTLFSSDLFGGLSDVDTPLFSAPGFPHSMDSFHEAYMPSGRILRAALAPLEELAIDRILPQHGSIIEGDDVQVAFDHLKQLPVGIDLGHDEP